MAVEVVGESKQELPDNEASIGCAATCRFGGVLYALGLACSDGSCVSLAMLPVSLEVAE